ncbi:MAG: 16S rRNA (cytidine(1402)-2'-O)-methyltransferase [Candidatus Pacebacteria bacterium]|nr:16S rRNA (cytidine(1402)-2'-O)-methyltransferase [Candidatus Paceibacterota bacterium]
METGTLFVVATPIGNLEDITLRALRVLGEVDYVLCEDTRVTGKLLAHYELKKQLKRYDAHASEQVHVDIIDDLLAGKKIALVSDAGTPGVSDPGVLLVTGAREAGARVEVIPGASSITAAISLAGIAGNQFTFLGFAPQKKGRDTFFKGLATLPVQPVVFLESTHRIMKALEKLSAAVPTATVYLARELTKLHETLHVGTAADLLQELQAEPVKQKGEFVVLVKAG